MTIERIVEAGHRKFEIKGTNLTYPTRFREGSSTAALFIVDSHVARGLRDRPLPTDLARTLHSAGCQLYVAAASDDNTFATMRT